MNVRNEYWQFIKLKAVHKFSLSKIYNKLTDPVGRNY